MSFPSLIKPPMWALSPGLVAPEWGWFWSAADFVLPLWERGGFSFPLGKKSTLLSPSLLGSPVWENNQLNFNGTDQGQIIDGDIRDYAVDPFTIIMRFRTTETDNGVVFGGAGNSAGGSQHLAIFQNQEPSSANSGLKFILREEDGSSVVRGSTTTAHRDGKDHIAIVTWDTSPSPSLLQFWLDETRLNTPADDGIMNAPSVFNRRALGFLRRSTNVLFANCGISLWAELDQAISTTQRLQITRDPFGPFRMADEVGVVFATGGPFISDYRFRQRFFG